MSAGSPGIRCSMEKVRREIPIRTGMTWIRRCAMNLCMHAPARPVPSSQPLAVLLACVRQRRGVAAAGQRRSGPYGLLVQPDVVPDRRGPQAVDGLTHDFG